MTNSLWALLGFAMWTWALVALGVVPWRSFAVLAGKRAANDFPAHEPHGPDLYQRLTRAHLNCLENLPIFGAVVLIGAVTSVSSESFHNLALVTFTARIAQTLVHLSSTSPMAVQIRFGFYLVQLGAIGGMAGVLAGFVG
jgi:uncharacterized MAPEG superfamily protein